MITTLGKGIIKSYLAGLVPSIGQSIALGIRPTTESVDDTALGFEIVRVPVTSISLDPSSDKIIFKGTMANASSVTVSEVGLWASVNSPDSMLVLGFDQFDEAWTGELSGFSTSPTASRVNGSLMEVDISGTVSKVASNVIPETDLSSLLGPDDVWKIALNKVGSASLTVRLKLVSMEGSLEMNFFPSNLSSTGYSFGQAVIKDAVLEGSFDPTAVTQFDISVVPESGNAASATVELDAVIADNATYEREGSVLVARSVITPFSSDSSSPTDVEYALEVIL